VSARSEELYDMLAPVVASLGVELWGIEVQGSGRNMVLRIYIDSDQGITVDDCAKVSRQVSSELDVEDPIPGEYRLEVSSPGWDRPLFRLDQYPRYVGQKLKLRFTMQVAGKRGCVGTLRSVDGDTLLIDVPGEDGPISVSFQSVRKAHLVIED